MCRPHLTLPAYHGHVPYQFVALAWLLLSPLDEPPSPLDPPPSLNPSPPLDLSPYIDPPPSYGPSPPDGLSPPIDPASSICPSPPIGPLSHWSEAHSAGSAIDKTIPLFNYSCYENTI